MKENKVIYFDLFDTLVTADRGVLEPYFTREADRMGDNGILRDAKSTMELLSQTSPEMLEQNTIDEMAKYYDERMAYLISNVRPEVLEMLQDLKSDGWRLCVISDAARVDIAGWDRSPLAQYFDATVFSCDVGYVKPDPRLFEMAKQVMGEPEHCVFIGDGGHEELMGAQRAGMITMKAEYIKNRRDELITQHADIRATTTKRVAEQARNIDFSKRYINKDSVFTKTVRSMIEQGAHANKEQTEEMTRLYDMYKLATHRLGVDLGLSNDDVEKLTNEMLGHSKDMSMTEKLKIDIETLNKTNPQSAMYLISGTILNAGFEARSGIDALEEKEKAELAFDLEKQIGFIEPIVESLGIEYNLPALTFAQYYGLQNTKDDIAKQFVERNLNADNQDIAAERGNR